jgi:peptide/nickel transport system ATP-binding protein
VVGESGCGKSTLGRTIIHLLESTGGRIFFRDEDITRVSAAKLRKLREDMQIIFQDPYSSLNPRLNVEDTIKEPLVLSKRFSKKEISNATAQVMDLVGIDVYFRKAYPHELDGGRRQRVGIARALSLNPKFIVCDEPVSALDVSIQAQVLNLLQDLQKKFDLTYIFITHNLSVVRYLSTDICVMYMGQQAERCRTEELFANPLHPYTKALLSAIPAIDIHNRQKRIILEGEIFSPINPKPGCRFSARCKYANEKCALPQVSEEITPGHFVSCCMAREINNIRM